MKADHHLSYDVKGFWIVKPKIDNRKFYEWESIDTIIFQPFVIPRPGTYWKQRCIVFLNKPPQKQLDANAFWINRIVFKLFCSADSTTLSLYDIMPNFESFLLNAAQAMAFPLSPQKGKSERFKVKTDFSEKAFGAAYTEIRSGDLPTGGNSVYEVIFDRWNRSFEEIYAQYG